MSDLIAPYQKILKALNLEKHLTGRQIARLLYPTEFADDTKNPAYQRVMKNLKTLEKKLELIKQKRYGMFKSSDAFWSLAKHKTNADLGLAPPKGDVHTFKYLHEKECADVFVSVALTGLMTRWETPQKLGTLKSGENFIPDRTFDITGITTYLENERGEIKTVKAQGKIEAYQKYHRDTKESFAVLFLVQDEAALENVVKLFDGNNLTDHYHAGILSEFVKSPLEAPILTRSRTLILSDHLSN